MLKAKVADKFHTIEQGLMFVKDMPKDEGMLFVFSRAQRLSFWGKNTFIPLDIAFVDHNNTIRKIANIKPFCLDPVVCDDRCVYAIEANAGYFKENSISEGDVIDIDRPSFKDDAHITFRKTKDSASKQGKTKEGQTAPVGAVPPTVPKNVGSPEPGQPMATQPNDAEQPEPQNLPALGPEDIGKYLEDDLEAADDQVQDGLDGDIDQTPEEQPPTDENPEGYPVFANVFEAMEWAEKNGEVVRINYRTKKGTALVRDVEPHGRFHAQSTKREILVTYDETIDGIRAFIATNVGNWAFVGRKFQKKFVVRA